MTWDELIKKLEEDNIAPEQAKKMIYLYKVIKGVIELEKDDK